MVIQITHTDDFPSTGTRLVSNKQNNISDTLRCLISNKTNIYIFYEVRKSV